MVASRLAPTDVAALAVAVAGTAIPDALAGAEADGEAEVVAHAPTRATSIQAAVNVIDRRIIVGS
jgi:hypothetical protein